MYFRAFVTLIFALCATQALGIDFSSSKWIWTNEVNAGGGAPVGSRAFRRDFFSPAGRSAISANIIIISDNAYTLYVNGNQIGSGVAFNGGSSNADAYCLRLAPDCNVFAVNATNIGPVGSTTDPAGLLATIQIRYDDGFTDTIVTDSTWHSFKSVPAGFQEIVFDDSAWPAATVQGNFGVSPWGAVAVPSAASSTPLQLIDANWIWTNELNSARVAPVGARAFRKDITLPAGQFATSATILIGTDDEFTLYLQGRVVASGTVYTQIHRYVVDIVPPASEISLAVYAVNNVGNAGLISAVELTMEDCDCGSVTSFVTDSTWKYKTTVPANFTLPGFDDSAWANAVVEGKYGIAPWGDLTVPSTVEAASAPLSGAPSANAADVVA